MIQELDLAGNWFGKLQSEVKERVIKYVEDPTPENWDDIHGLILSVEKGTGLGLTVWQAVLQISPSFPRVGRRYEGRKVIKEWAEIPTIEQIETALRYATH